MKTTVLLSACAWMLAILLIAPTARAVETGIVTGVRHADTSIDEHAETNRLGADWARIQVLWSHLEPTKGQIHEDPAAYYDYLIQGYRDRGVKVLVTLVDAPAWAVADASAPSGVEQPPKDPADYASILSRLAGRQGWKGQVAAYEIWNEPDTAASWHPAPSASAYAALVKAAAPAIRAADPAAKVITGGLDGADVAFLSDVYDAGMTGSDVDGIGVHMSQSCRTDMPGVSYRESDGRLGRYAFTGYRELYRETVERGVAEEIWMTEFGISTLTNTCAEGPAANHKAAGVTEGEQASFLTKAYECMAADTFVGPAMWWTLQDIDADPAKSGHWMGLFRNNNTERPAATSMFAFNGGSITPDPACGGKVDTTSPVVTIEAPPTFTTGLQLDLKAIDQETSVGRMYFTVRRADAPPESQVQIPGSGTGGHYALFWAAAKDLPLNVPHVVTGYAFDEAKNIGGASATVTRIAEGVVVTALRTKSSLDVSAKKGRRAVVKGTFTYTAPPAHPLRGRGRLYVEYFDAKGKKDKWVTTSRFTLLQSALRRSRVIDRKTGERQATFTKAMKLPGKERKWRALFEFDGLEPFQDSRAMIQFRAKG